jgi:pyrroloquinoline quinone biosynthesis protein B
MRVRVLGTAAGGGAPQWNCGCPTCDRARRAGTARTQDGLAVSGDGETWFLVNASPDLRTQLLAVPEFVPSPGSRRTPVHGVLLTSAELDHTLGLLALREAERLTVFATAPVHAALDSAHQSLRCYTEVSQENVRGGQTFELPGNLRVTALVLSSKRPRYAAGMPEGDWVVAYRFSGASGRHLVYAPGLAQWTDEFAEFIRGADVVLVDGTFHTEDELSVCLGRDRPASSMGHPAVRDLLPVLAANPGPRYLLTHLNNTNPLVLPDASERAELAAANAEVAEDNQLLVL